MATEADAQVADFVAAVYRDEIEWHVEVLEQSMADDLEDLIEALQRRAAAAGTALGMVSVSDDFFVLARVADGDVRLLLSDVTAGSEWPIARAVLDELEIPVPDDDDEHVEPAGDLGIVSDFGLDTMELAALCDDIDLYPDEMLGSIASRLGFGDQFQRALQDASD